VCFLRCKSSSYNFLVSSYRLATNQKQEEFVVLELGCFKGDVTLVQSKTTGNFYTTAMKANITSTFSEEVAATRLGKQLPGQIIKQECEPYDYTISDTGETITLTYTYEYTPEEKPKPFKAKEFMEELSLNGVGA